MRGWYVEAGYDVMPLLKPGTRMSLEPFVRWEEFDTQHEVASGFRRNQARDIDLLVAGIQFKPIPQIVFKLDDRHFDPDGGDRADEIQGLDRKTHILKSEEMERIQKRVHQEIESRLVVFQTAYQDDRVIGYAHIDVHVVRTQPEAFLIVLDPDGQVRSVRILAFHEPLDYPPTNSWYAQFAGKTREDRLRIGYDVHGVVGATLSARAAADGVRRMLAYWEVLLRPDTSETPGHSDAGEPRVAGTPAREPAPERSKRPSRAE